MYPNLYQMERIMSEEVARRRAAAQSWSHRAPVDPPVQPRVLFRLWRLVFAWGG